MITRIHYEPGTEEKVFDDNGRQVGSIVDRVYLSPLGLYYKYYDPKTITYTDPLIVFGVAELEEIRNKVDLVQMVPPDPTLPVKRELTMEIILSHGYWWNTNRGRRWVVALELWKEGHTDVEQ